MLYRNNVIFRSYKIYGIYRVYMIYRIYFFWKDRIYRIYGNKIILINRIY